MSNSTNYENFGSGGANELNDVAQSPATFPVASRTSPLLRRRPHDLRRQYYQRINVITSASEILSFPSYNRPQKMSIDDSFFEIGTNPLERASMQSGTVDAMQPVPGVDVKLSNVIEESSTKETTETNKISLVKSIFNLTNTTLGAGTLAMPYYIAQTGFALGFALLALVAALSDFALVLLLDCGRITQMSSYYDVAKEVFGRTGGVIVQITLFLLTFGALTAYIVIIGTLSEMGIQQIGVMSPNIDLNATFAYLNTNSVAGGFTLICILPLGMLKNMSALSFASLLSLFAICYVVLAVSYMNVVAIVDTIKTTGFFPIPKQPIAHISMTIFQIFPTAGLAFTNHTNIYEITREMKQSTKKRQKWLIHSTTLATFLFYTLISIPGYLRFSNNTCDDILLNFKMNGTSISSDCIYVIPNQSKLDQILVLIAILSMTTSMILSAPIILFPCRMCFHEIIRPCIAVIPGSTKLSGTFYRITETVLILGMAYLISCLTSSISTVFGLTGSITGSLLV